MGDFEWRVGVLKNPRKFWPASGSALTNQILQGKISLQIELLGPDRESEQKYKKLDCEIIHGLDIQARVYLDGEHMDEEEDFIKVS